MNRAARQDASAAAEHDGRRQRCRRLGHEVPFSYCRSQADGRLCNAILDCWWEIFDVDTFLREQYPEALAEMIARPPVSRIAALADVIDRTQRAARDTPPT